MANRPLPPQDVLRQLLDYNPDTGALLWKERGAEWFKNGAQTAQHNQNIWNAKNAGRAAFITPTWTGHLYAGFLGKKILAHRAIWKWMTGEDPETVDHINGDPSDNRWVNLRDTSQKINTRNSKISKNNTSGITGIYWSKPHRKWCAHITIDYRKRHLGLFPCIGQAILARKEADRRHGFHPNHGRAA